MHSSEKLFFKKMGHPRPVIRLFMVSFKQTMQILQQIIVKKSPSSIRHQESNSQPSDCESPPLTTSDQFRETWIIQNIFSLADRSLKAMQSLCIDKATKTQSKLTEMPCEILLLRS